MKNTNALTEIYKKVQDKLKQIILKDTSANVRDAAVSLLATFKIILQYTDGKKIVDELIKSLPKYRVSEIQARFEAYQENLAKMGLVTARNNAEGRESELERPSASAQRSARGYSAKSGATSKRGGKSNEKYSSKVSEAEGRPSNEFGAPNLHNVAS